MIHVWYYQYEGSVKELLLANADQNSLGVVSSCDRVSCLRRAEVFKRDSFRRVPSLSVGHFIRTRFNSCDKNGKRLDLHVEGVYIST